jgi:hypothetical protein
MATQEEKNRKLWEACGENGTLSRVQQALSDGADINSAGEIGEGPALSEAAVWAHPDIVRYLIQHGANIDHQGGEGETALSLAADTSDVMTWDDPQTEIRRRTMVIRILLDAGADRSLRDRFGLTARDHAVLSVTQQGGNLVYLFDTSPPGGEPAGGAKKKKRRAGRRFTRKQCKKFKCAKMGFTQKASCRPYKNCYRSKKSRK